MERERSVSVVSTVPAITAAVSPVVTPTAGSAPVRIFADVVGATGVGVTLGMASALVMAVVATPGGGGGIAGFSGIRSAPVIALVVVARFSFQVGYLRLTGAGWPEFFRRHLVEQVSRSSAQPESRNRGSSPVLAYRANACTPNRV